MGYYALRGLLGAQGRGGLLGHEAREQHGAGTGGCGPGPAPREGSARAH